MSEPKRRGRPPRSEALASSRQCWEYEQVAYSEPPLRAELNRYGALGWELVGIYASEKPMHDATFYAVFKREIAN